MRHLTSSQRLGFQIIVLLAVSWLFQPVPPTQGGQAVAIPRAMTFGLINLALGYLHTGILPNYSEPAFEKMLELEREDFQQLLHTDLRALFPSDGWSREPNVPFLLKGGDIGRIYLIKFAWWLSSSTTLWAFLQFLVWMQRLGVVALFFLLRQSKIRYLPFAGAMIYATSYPMAVAALDFSFYALVPTFVILITFMFHTALRLRLQPWAIAAMATAGFCIALFAEVRGHLIYYTVPLAALLIIKAWRQPPKQPLFLLLTLLAATLLTNQAIKQWTWNDQRQALHGSRLHPFWHPIWCGLGEFPNPYGFVWDDHASRNYLTSVDPKVGYATAAHGAILRRHVLSTIAHDPLWFLGVLGKRMLNLARGWLSFLPGGLLVPGWIAALLFFGGLMAFVTVMIRDKAQRPFLYILLPLAADTACPLLVCGIHFFYALTAHLAVGVMLAYILLYNIKFYRHF